MTSSTDMTDEELLQSYSKSGDSESLGAFLTRYQDSLLRFATRLLGDHHSAQDVVQETFLRVARHPGRLLHAKNRCNWLLCVVRNIAIDQVRRSKARRKHTQLLTENIAAGSPRESTAPLSALEASELRERVLREIGRLKIRSREVVLLKIQEGKSYREIAEITGLSVTNVGFVLHKAIKELSVRLNHSKPL